MSTEKKLKCCDCGYALTQYEINDNIYAGLPETNFVCYMCQHNDVVGNSYADEDNDDYGGHYEDDDNEF